MKPLKNKKNVFMPMLLAIAIMILPTYIQASEPEVERYDDSDFYRSETADYIWHYVDTVAQLCYIKHANKSFALIPCDNLKKRPEWKNIIKW